MNRRPLLAAILIAAFAVAVYGGLARRGLYHDGVIYFLYLLARETFAWWEPARVTAHTLQQAPLLAALWLELGGLDTAILLYSTTLQALPLLLTAISYFCFPPGRRHLFVFPLMHYLAGTLSAAGYPQTEASLASAYFWLLLPLILFRAQRLPGALLVLLLALPFAVAHEAMALLSPLLAAAAAWRWRGAEGPTRRAWMLLVLFLIACTAAQLGWILAPRSAQNRDELITALLTLRWLAKDGAINVPAAVGLAGLLALAAIRVLELAGVRAGTRAAGLLLAAAVAALAAVLIARVAIDPRLLDPAGQMHARVQPALVSLPLGAALLWSALRPRADLARLSASGAALVAIVAVAALAWHVIAIRHWADFLRDYAAVLERHRGLVAWSEAVSSAPEGGRRLSMFAPSSRAPSLSIVLAPEGRVSAIIASPPETQWAPFDPAKPEQLPRSRLLDLAPYLRALVAGERR